MRIGVLGGTFDPPHLGHLAVARDVAAQLQLDRIVFVPTGDSWQKETTTPAMDRLAMVDLAIAGEGLFVSSDVDVQRAGPTFTFDTLMQLRAEYGAEAELFFLLGSDALAGLPTWRRASELGQLATFVGFGRPGHDPIAPAGFESWVHVVSVTPTDISSTQCRQKLAAGESVVGLMPPAVIDYATARGLYAGVRE
ncbi:MAG: nicotinate-nucleotide adenylyltransferase [Actinobacteria bacterium]|nr:nicotinate-nucleotide adenylyltransferase [Actinomycetota bacterium]